MATQKKARRYGSAQIWASPEEDENAKKSSAPKLGSPSPTLTGGAPKTAQKNGGGSVADTLSGVSRGDVLQTLLGIGSFASGKGIPSFLTAPRGKGLTKDQTFLDPPGKKSGSHSMDWFDQVRRAAGKQVDSFQRPGKKIFRGTGGPKQETEQGMVPGPLPEFGKSLSDYLAEAGDGSQLMGPQNALFDARQADLTKRAGLGDQALQALYAQLGNSMGQAAERESGRYAEQADVAKARADATQGNIAASRAQASDAEKAVAASLGLGDRSQSVSAQQGAIDGAMSQSATAARGLSQQELMQSLGNSQNDYFRGNEAAAGFRGAEARASLQGDLQSRLADISDARGSAQVSAAAEARSLAAQRYAADYGQFNDQRGYQDSRDQTAYDRSWQQTQAQNEMRLGQQRIQAERDTRMSEASAKYMAEQEKRTPAYARIQQQLVATMPPERASLVMEEIARARLQGADLESALGGKVSPSELRMALLAANEYNSSYK